MTLVLPLIEKGDDMKAEKWQGTKIKDMTPEQLFGLLQSNAAGVEEFSAYIKEEIAKLEFDDCDVKAMSKQIAGSALELVGFANEMIGVAELLSKKT